MPKISLCIPTYEMNGHGLAFLKRALISIEAQSFEDYEVIITDDSQNDEIENYCLQVEGLRYFKNPTRLKMAGNTNKGINLAQGELIKLLYQDDYLAHRHALREMVKHLTPTYKWLVVACSHTSDGVHFFNEHLPYYSQQENTIGSPSVIMFRREITERFDERMSWVLDLDFYRRLLVKYGKPKILNQICVNIGIGPHQTTYHLTEEEKTNEYKLLKNVQR